MKLDLKVQGMTCLDCARRIEAALRRVEGARSRQPGRLRNKTAK